jgi:glycosyltransferase involved in cell wall biosynthesis
MVGELSVQRIRVAEIVGNAEGGGTKCVARIVRNLSNEHFDFLVVSPESPWLAEECARRGARYHPFPIASSRLSRGRYQELADILEREQPLIVSAHGTRAAWYAVRTLSGRFRPKLMYSEHLFSFDARRGVARLPWTFVERSICRHADAMATACGANADIAVTRGWIGPDRIVMRHYGVELDEFAEQARGRLARADLGIADDVPLIGTVGRLIPQKGMRYLLDAATRVLLHHPRAVFVIVGDGELRSSLEEHARLAGISNNVRFLGADRKPWRILANCDVIAFASLFEGLPQTCIEALSIGMPVVATRLKGTAELVTPESNGLLVPARDARALADGISRLLADRGLARRLGDAAPSAVTEYTTERMAERFERAYEMLAAEAVPGHASSALLRGTA